MRPHMLARSTKAPKLMPHATQTHTSTYTGRQGMHAPPSSCAIVLTHLGVLHMADFTNTQTAQRQQGCCPRPLAQCNTTLATGIAQRHTLRTIHGLLGVIIHKEYTGGHKAAPHSKTKLRKPQVDTSPGRSTTRLVAQQPVYQQARPIPTHTHTPEDICCTVKCSC